MVRHPPSRATSALRAVLRRTRINKAAGLPAASLELLEGRRLLSSAPVAADDAYDLGPNGRLDVDVTVPSPIPENPVPPPRAFDASPLPTPAGPFTQADFVKVVEGGQVVTEPAYVEIGSAPDSFGEITVRDPGSRWTVADWLELGERGKGTMLVTDGGVAVVNNFFEVGPRGLGEVTVTNGGRFEGRNWLEIGGAERPDAAGGLGTVTVTGPASRWSQREFLQVGFGWSTGRLRLENGAQFVAGAGSDGGWVGVGESGGHGTVDITGGSLLQSGNFASVGTNAGGLGRVSVSGANSRWTVGNHLTVGYRGGRGTLAVSDGGLVQAANWSQIGYGPDGNGRVLVTGDGSRFVVSNWLDIGLGGGDGTLFIGEGATAEVRRGTGIGATSPRLINFQSGRILGSGTLSSAEVSNYGFISPGGSVGVLTLVGSLAQPLATPSEGPGGTLQFDIGGTARGAAYDGLDVSGAVSITGGEIRLNFVNAFAPRAGDRFTLIDGGASLTSAPRSVRLAGLAAGFQYTLAVEGNDLVLVANNDGVSAAADMLREGVLGNDSDSENDRLTAVLADRPDHGTLTLYSDGSFSYVAGPTYAGSDSFKYFADDGLSESNVATVTIRGAAPPNQPPTAVNDAYALDEDGRLSVHPANGVLSNDTDDNVPRSALTASLADRPTHGRLTLNPDGSFFYVPDRNFSGTDTFTYRAGDGVAQSDPATVTITVRPVQDAPVAHTDSKTTVQGQALTFPATDLTANDVDPDGDALTVTAVAATADTHGTVTLADGRVTYTPEAGYTGPARFNYTISDGHGGTATGTVSVTVTPPVTTPVSTPGVAAGRGTVDMRRRRFGFLVVAMPMRRSDVAARGMLTYEDAAARVSLRSTSITSFVIDAGGRKATITGTGSVNGRPGYTFVATAEDCSNSGTMDRFKIVITGPSGTNFSYDSTHNSRTGDRIDRGGNILVRPFGLDDDDEN